MDDIDREILNWFNKNMIGSSITISKEILQPVNTVYSKICELRYCGFLDRSSNQPSTVRASEETNFQLALET